MNTDHPKPCFQLSFLLSTHSGSLNLPLNKQNERYSTGQGCLAIAWSERRITNPTAWNSLITANEWFNDLAGLLLSHWLSSDVIYPGKWCDQCWQHFSFHTLTAKVYISEAYNITPYFPLLCSSLPILLPFCHPSCHQQADTPISAGSSGFYPVKGSFPWTLESKCQTLTMNVISMLFSDFRKK